MSYCRFSCDNWKSDVYVYEHVDGFYAIHVAGNKRVGDIPELPDLMKVSAEEFAEAYNAQMEAVARAELVPIGLPHDGASFDEPTAQDAANRLKELKALGYHIPAGVIEELESEGELNAGT